MRHAMRIALCAFLVAAGAAQAGARDELAAFTRGLKGLDGRFTQQVYDARGKLKESSSGQVALSAPRLFRWEYQKPYPQLIVADGHKVWIYDPDLQQVTVRPQGVEEQNSPLVALVDPGKLDAQFVVRETGSEQGLEWLTLEPKANVEANFRSARLGFGDGGLARMSIVDNLGQRTEIDFGAWRRNPDFAKGTFSYTPPAGVDVIGGEG
ncbi:outer membrane lipoprotein chaperone LolA [Vulcaniibacterium tengchongense]|uniref:Outer-membrane lipoprotein carrier protein n=1 Tax=Vulcaniibacterium tengchongense TaxID=1273429 RepID=A0A3N4VX16_9GAMM|nr:outer membrane lipoprotein chaperone LolA [Vulcaniibacterium tengchongense]RPE81647.1 outer membrane lipoprotein carrier protein [Vulcaniibacterium tengchongense]